MDKLTLIDVGARGGISARWQPFKQQITVYGFEADPEECAALNEKANEVNYLPHALGETDGEAATLYITRQPGCSSLLQPDLELLKQFPYGRNLEVQRTYPMTLARLDTICARHGIRPDVIKIDTQGTELSILKGCGGLLDAMFLVEVEVEFAPMYQGQPLLADVDVYMRSRGFLLQGLLRSYWKQALPPTWPAHPHGGRLMHADALYLRRVYSRKALVAYAAYRQFDLIVSMLSEPKGELALLSESERRALAGDLLPRELPFPLKVLSKVLSRYGNRDLRRFVDSLRPSSATDWHDADYY